MFHERKVTANLKHSESEGINRFTLIGLIRELTELESYRRERSLAFQKFVITSLHVCKFKLQATSVVYTLIMIIPVLHCDSIHY